MREKERKGRGWPGQGLPTQACLESAGLLEGHPEARDRRRGALRWPKGLHLGLSGRGSPRCAPFRSRSENRARRLCEPRVSARSRASARALQSLRSPGAGGRHPSRLRQLPLRPSLLHPSAPAAQPIRRFPALGDARSGGCCPSPPSPRPSWSAPGSRSPPRPPSCALEASGAV